MSTADPRRALLIPGRLCLNPSTIYPGTFPFGGTALGLKSEAAFSYGVSYRNVVAEEFGEVSEVVRIEDRPVFSFVLQQWDNDVIQAFFPSVTTSSSPSGITGISRINGGARPGLVTAMSPLLFAPYDPTSKAVLIHRPVPMLNETAKLNLSLKDPAVFALMVIATKDSNGKSYQVDLLEHLAL